MTQAIRIIPVGLPGAMSTLVAKGALADGLFLTDFSLTSPTRLGKSFTVEQHVLESVSPDVATSRLAELRSHGLLPIAVDYTTPTSALANIALYCRLNLPFVFATTGFDVARAHAMVAESTVSAVIAPNMAAPVVMLQSLMAYAADQFPGVLKGSRLQIIESHQSSKQDKSGTALAMSKYILALGAELEPQDFISIREPDAQRSHGVPEANLSGHAYHRYSVSLPDGSVDLALEHNVRGRQVYVEGTLRAVRFLARQIVQGSQGRVFSMVNVLSSHTFS